MDRQPRRACGRAARARGRGDCGDPAAREEARQPGAGRAPAGAADPPGGAGAAAGARGAPAAALSEFAALFEPAGPALRPLEAHAVHLGVWRVEGLARDVVALTEFVARVRREAKFHLSYGPEYARTADGGLRFRLDLEAAPNE
ncbi:hypothetical protein [Nannocystis pusilla]|uniref:hypothetical protein n=1 Tax=Nannocystis pusilla TaxID=889268 RepID=UPI003B79F55C